jgi:hypothetical protein
MTSFQMHKHVISTLYVWFGLFYFLLQEFQPVFSWEFRIVDVVLDSGAWFLFETITGGWIKGDKINIKARALGHCSTTYTELDKSSSSSSNKTASSISSVASATVGPRNLPSIISINLASSSNSSILLSTSSPASFHISYKNTRRLSKKKLQTLCV